MKIKIVNKLIISFSLIILISTAIGVFVSSKQIDENFEEYLENKKQNKMNIVVDAIENNFSVGSGLEYTRDIELLAKSEGFLIEVTNNVEEVLYRSSDLYLKNTGDNLFNDQMTRSKDDIFQTFYKEKKYDLIKNNQVYGTINIGFYSIDNCDLTDLKMKDTIYHILTRTSIITLLTGIVMSIILARNLSKPLKKMSRFTEEVRQGNLKSKLKIKSYTKEVLELSDSIKYLVDTLDKQDMLRKQLTSDMAHEIRTPLTTLQNTMEAFLDGIWKPSQDRIESCYEETLRLSKLVEGLNDIAKLENMNMTIEVSQFDLPTEVNRVVDLFKYQYENKGISLELVSDEDIMIVTDKNKLKQVIVNLLNNAYIYTNQGGQVEVLIENLRDSVSISVIDSGIGICRDELPFIFERFYRTDQTRNRETGGTGIGLTISKAIVDLLGGSIEVESEKDKGSKFIVVVTRSL